MASFMFLVLSYLFELLKGLLRSLTRLLWENELSVSTEGARNVSISQKAASTALWIRDPWRWRWLNFESRHSKHLPNHSLPDISGFKLD